MVCVVLGAAAGLAATALMPKKYTATASVLVSATGVDETAQTANGRTSGVINLDTEAQLVRSADVVTRAQKRQEQVPDGPTRQVVENVSVTVPANTTVLNIAFTADTAEVAQVSANAFAHAYLADREATAEASLNKQIRDSENSVESLTTKLKDLAQAEASLPKNSRQRSFNDAQRSLLTSQISTINQRLIALRSTQITPGRILTAAPLPSSPSSPSRILNLASGIAVGLVLGLLVAWLRITHRRSVRRRNDLDQSVDVPTVAEIRALEANSPVAVHSQAAEVYRRLSVLTMAAIKGSGTVVISTAGSSRSDSTVAVNLAAALTAGGTSVCLLRIASEADDPVVPVDSDDIDVVIVDRAETVRLQFGGASTSDALLRVRGDRDVLIIDAPCPTYTADAQTLAVLSDAVLMVVDVGARVRHVRDAIEAFDAVAAPMLGSVLVHTKKGRAAHPGNADGKKVRIDPDAVGAQVGDERGSASPQRGRVPDTEPAHRVAKDQNGKAQGASIRTPRGE